MIISELFIKILNVRIVRLYIVKLLHLFYTSQIPDSDSGDFDNILSYKVDCIDSLLELEK